MEFYKLYAEMAAAAEKIRRPRSGIYSEVPLIAALQNCEELYISGQEADQQD